MATTFLSDAQPVVYGVSASATTTSNYIDMAKFSRLQFIVVGGSGYTGTNTLDFKLRQATDTSGTSAKDISGKAITTLTGTNAASAVTVLNIGGFNLDAANGFKTCAATVTVGGAGTFSLLALGDPEATPPTTSNGVASVQVL